MSEGNKGIIKKNNKYSVPMTAYKKLLYEMLRFITFINALNTCIQCRGITCNLHMNMLYTMHPT